LGRISSHKRRGDHLSVRQRDDAITDGVAVNASTIDACPELHLMAVAATSYNHIDLSACHA